MRAVLKPRRLFAVLLVFVLIGSTATADDGNWLKRITTESIVAGIDMYVRGTATGELGIPSERAEKRGMGLLIGDPPDQQSAGLTVSGSPDVDVTLNGEAETFGVGIYAWEQSNTVTLDGGSIRTTTTEDDSNIGWGGMSGLRLMSAPGGSIKLKSTASISVNDPENGGKYNIGVWIKPEPSIYTTFYELNGTTVPVTNNVDYGFMLDSLHGCEITETENSEPYDAYVQFGQDGTTLIFFDNQFHEIGTATETAERIRKFTTPTVSFVGGQLSMQRTPLTNVQITRTDGSGTIACTKVAYTQKLTYNADIQNNHVYILDDQQQVYIWEKRTFAPCVSDNRPSEMEAELGGTVSVQGIRARGIEMTSSEDTKEAVSLLPGASLTAKGDYTQIMYLSTMPGSLAPLTVNGSGNVSLVSESSTGCASGIMVIAQETDVSVSITGSGNKMTVTSTTNDVSGTDKVGEKPKQASAFLIRPAGEDNTAAIRFEGDVDVRGGLENGIYATPILGGVVRMELIGDLTLTDSMGDGIYQAYNAEIPLLTGKDNTGGKSCDVFMRGNLNLVDARGGDWSQATAGVTLRAGRALIDGDVTVSGTGTLRGVYADSMFEDAVVVVTGEVKGPVPIRIPLGDEVLPNYARVYVWKTDLSACQNAGDQIGFVLKIDEEQPALENVTLSCASEGNRFLDPITWEERTYYGAFAGDEITINGFPAGYKAVVTDADGNPVEVTEKDGKYTFLTPATGGAKVSAKPIITYSIVEGDGATWIKGSDEGLDFTVKGTPDDTDTFVNFTGIEVDGTATAATNYTAAEGSVKLNLKASYLESLSEGKHLLAVLFKDGKADGSFNISLPEPSPSPTPTPTPKPTATPRPLPKTGDTQELILWGGMVLLGILGISGVIAARHRKQKH